MPGKVAMVVPNAIHFSRLSASGMHPVKDPASAYLLLRIFSTFRVVLGPSVALTFSRDRYRTQLDSVIQNLA